MITDEYPAGANPTAVATARSRFPDVTFTAADVLHPPAEWTGAFDLVYEAYTIQVLRGQTARRRSERSADSWHRAEDYWSSASPPDPTMPHPGSPNH